MHRQQLLSRITRATMAVLVAVAAWTVAPSNASAQVQPDMTITMNPLGQSPQRTVQVGDQISIHVFAWTLNNFGGEATIRVTFPMGFTNVTTSDASGLTCDVFGPKPEYGGTAVRCVGSINPTGAMSSVAIHAKAPTTLGKFEVTGGIYPSTNEDLNANDNIDSVWVTTINKSGLETHPNPNVPAPGVGVEVKPNPNTRGPGMFETKPNPNVRK